MIPGINGSVLASAYRASKLKRRYADGGPIKPSAKLNSVDPQGQASYQAGLQSGPVNLGVRGAANIPQFKNTSLQPSLEYKAKSLNAYLNPKNVGGSYEGKSTYLNADYNIPDKQTNLAAGYNSDKLSLNANANLEKNKLMNAGVSATYNFTPNLSLFGDLNWEKTPAEPATSYNAGFKYLKNFAKGGRNPSEPPIDEKPPRPSDLPVLPANSGKVSKWLYDQANNRQKRLQAEYDVKTAADQEIKYVNNPKYAELLTAEFYGPDRLYTELSEEEAGKIDNIISNRRSNLESINLVSADLTKKGIKAGYDPNLNTMYVPKTPTDRGVHSHELSHVGDQSNFEEGVNPGVGTYFTEQIQKGMYPKESSEFLNQPSSLKLNQTVGGNKEKDFTEAEYLQEPTEVKARLRALRDSSIQQGYKLLEPGYDINKYKKGFNKEEQKQYDQLKSSGLSDDKINELMYLFAKNQTNPSKTAKVGARIDNDDKEMVDGISSILRRVKDPKNRLQLARELSQQFNREKVNYSLPSFLDKSNVTKFKSGGQHGGLDRWFAEKWVDVKTGEDCGRSGTDKDGRPYPACRPSKRISSETPKTSSEMSSQEKAKFKATKTSSQRIPYNHKRN